MTMRASRAITSGSRGRSRSKGVIARVTVITRVTVINSRSNDPSDPPYSLYQVIHEGQWAARAVKA